MFSLCLLFSFKSNGYTDNVEFSAEDASRSERDFLCRVVETAIKAGATTINLPDTVGYAQPQEFADLIRYVIENTPNSDKAIFSVHCHNDLGLAVANTLAALSVGARQAEVTISGIGERAGNAALEELAMALRVRKDYYGLEHGIVTEQLYPSCRLLSMTIGQPIPNNKAIVGANAFAHESGIHQDGMLKNRETYEIMTPQSVGRNESNLVIGKHSGRNAVRNKFESLGYSLDDDQLQIVFEAVKALADRKKTLHDDDLMALVQEEVYRMPDLYRLRHVSVQSSDAGGVPPTAAVLMDVDGMEKSGAGFGVGPVDAIFNVINDMLGREPQLEQYAVNAVTGGTLIPTLTLGIPGESVTAVLMGGLIIHGLQPGPELFTTYAGMTYTFFAGFVLVQFFMLGVGILLPYSFSTLVTMAGLGGKGVFMIVLTLAAAWLADSGAYFAGTFFGKTKLCPEISPKKTVEGLIGGVISNGILMLIISLFYQFVLKGEPIHYLGVLIAGMLAALIGLVGDLTASVIKRQTGIKDYGNIMPGHGGIMDRFDSVLLVAPFMYYMFTQGLILK